MAIGALPVTGAEGAQFNDDVSSSASATAIPGTADSAARELTEVAGFRFDCLTELEFADRIVSQLAQGCGGYAVTINTDILYLARNDPALREMLGGADIAVADGMPVVWASRLARRSLPERVAGSSALHNVAEAAALRGQAVFLLGGRPGAAEEAAARLRTRYPTLRIGSFCPPVGFEEDVEAMGELYRRLEEFGPAVCFCGLGTPKQEKLIAHIRTLYPEHWFIGCGGTLDFAAGMTSRAPSYVQRLGMEWAWRLVHEPRRLARRYLRQDLPFAAGMLLRAWTHREKPLPSHRWAATASLLAVSRTGLRLAGRSVGRRRTH